MECRVAVPEDLAGFEQLWGSCFEPPGDPFFEWFFHCYRPTGRSLGAWEDAALRAGAHLMPYQIYHRGVNIPVDYLVGLATAADYRGRGIAGELLAACLADMDQRGNVICLLMPAHPGFYYQYGWEIVYHHLRYQAAPPQLRQLTRLCQPVRQAQGIANWAELDPIYRKFVAGHNGYVLRSAVNWRHLLQEHAAEGGSVALTYRDDVANGYLLYVSKDQQLNVVEMAYADKFGSAALYDFLYHQEQVKTVTWDGPEDDYACYRLEEPQQSVSLYPFVAARVVNILRALNRVTLPAERIGPVTIRVSDSLAPWNNGEFQLTLEQGWQRIDDPADGKADISLDIGAFTQWFMGKVPLSALTKAGRAEGQCQAIEALDRCLPPCQNYIGEYF